MAKIEDCPGFETFGADVKAARKAKQLSRSALADMIHCDSTKASVPCCHLECKKGKTVRLIC